MFSKYAADLYGRLFQTKLNLVQTKNTLGVSVLRDLLIKGWFSNLTVCKYLLETFSFLSLPQIASMPHWKRTSRSRPGDLCFDSLLGSHANALTARELLINLYHRACTPQNTASPRVAQEPLASSEIFVLVPEFSVNLFLLLCLISMIILRKKLLETCSGLSVEPLYNKGRSASEQRRK